MNRHKIFIILAMVLVLGVLWIMGCTGEGAYEGGGGPAPTGTSTNTPGPTPSTVGSEHINMYKGGSNTYDLVTSGNHLKSGFPLVNMREIESEPNKYYYTHVGEDVFWCERGTNGLIYRETHADKWPYKRPYKSDPIIPEEKLISGSYGKINSVISYRLATDKSKDAEQGPRAAGDNDLDKFDDYIFFSTSDGQIWYYNITQDVGPKKLYTLGFGDNDIITMINYGTRLFFVGNNGSDSIVYTIAMFPETAEEEQPYPIGDYGFSYLHDIYLYVHDLPSSDFDSVKVVETGQELDYPDDELKYLFLTSMVSGNEGKVFMLDLTGVEPRDMASVDPIVITSNGKSPARITYMPDIEEYFIKEPDDDKIKKAYHYHQTERPNGYLYWTEFSATNGLIKRQRLEWSKKKKKFLPYGSTETVANSMLSPYDIMSPYDFKYIYYVKPYDSEKYDSTGNNELNSLIYPYDVWNTSSGYDSDIYNKLWISKNLDTQYAGTWLCVEVSEASEKEFPLNPTDHKKYITKYVGDNVSYPLHGFMQNSIINYQYKDSDNQVIQNYVNLSMQFFYTGAYNVLQDKGVAGQGYINVFQEYWTYTIDSNEVVQAPPGFGDYDEI